MGGVPRSAVGFSFRERALALAAFLLRSIRARTRETALGSSFAMPCGGIFLGLFFAAGAGAGFFFSVVLGRAPAFVFVPAFAFGLVFALDLALVFVFAFGLVLAFAFVVVFARLRGFGFAAAFLRVGDLLLAGLRLDFPISLSV